MSEGTGEYRTVCIEREAEGVDLGEPVSYPSTVCPGEL